MEAITRGGHPYTVGANVGRWSTIPWVARAGITGHHEKQESHFSHYGNGSREEFVVHVASPKHEQWHDRSSSAIGFIAKQFSAAMSSTQHFMHQVGQPAVGKGCTDCV